MDLCGIPSACSTLKIAELRNMTDGSAQCLNQLDDANGSIICIHLREYDFFLFVPEIDMLLCTMWSPILGILGIFGRTKIGGSCPLEAAPAISTAPR